MSGAATERGATRRSGERTGTRARTRTLDPRIKNPVTDLRNQGSPRSLQRPVAAACTPACTCKAGDAGLAQVVAAWQSLAPHVKEAIVTLTKVT